MIESDAFGVMEPWSYGKKTITLGQNTPSRSKLGSCGYFIDIVLLYELLWHYFIVCIVFSVYVDSIFLFFV